MKKSLLLLSALALVFASHKANAQLINPGFETWSTDMAVPTAMNPNSGNATTGWDDYNFFNYAPIGGSPISVFRCDTAHSGTYSARIVTKIYTQTSWNYYKAWGIPFIGHNYKDTLGILFNGNQNEQTITYEPGIPFTQKINTFSFYYQYFPQTGDTAECRVSLVHNRVLQGGGLVQLNSTGATWQQATITFTYVDTQTPDTLYILFSSSSLDHKPISGSELLVDDVSVTLLTGVNNIQLANDINIYPNPSSGKINVQMSQFKNVQMEIYNMMGECVHREIARSSNQQIDLSEVPNGIYFLQLRTEQGIATKKLVISR